MKAAELTPSAQKIDKIIKRIDEGDIKIPAFQRGYVWKQDQIIDLLESVVSEYPIGSILLWKTDEHLKSTRNIAGYNIPKRDESYPVNYALDGQQRMASLYGVFSQKVEQESDPANYNPTPNIFEIFYDLKEKHFICKNDVVDRSSCILLRNLLDVTTLIPELEIIKPIYRKEAQELQSRFINYEIPVVTIENRSREDVGIIFERINSTGTKLSALDLMTAWTWTDNFHLLDACNTLLKKLKKKGYGEIKQKTLLQIISALIQNSTVTKNILSVDSEQVRKQWDSIVKSCEKAIDFLVTDLKCTHLDFLPYTQQLIPITKFFQTIKSPDANQLTALRKYFWKTSFSNRYSTGQTTYKMDADIRCINNLAKGDLTVFDEYTYTITESELLKTKFLKSNPNTRAFLVLMAQSAPKDLLKNQTIDLDKSLAQFNRKEYHHVFPQAFLKQTGKNADQIGTLLNFCFLSSDSNKKIAAKQPSDYFFNEIKQKAYKEILESNLLPSSRSCYKSNNYEDFLEKRASVVMDLLDNLTN